MNATTIFFLLALAGTAAPDAPAPMSGGAVAYNGHRYLLIDDFPDLSWDRARDACSEEGGHLAVVTSEEEAAFIAGLCDGTYAFLGASDAATEGTWVWVDGSEWGYTHWATGQPNDYGGVEDYLATYDGGKWVDVEASGDDFWMPTGFVCEWDD